MEHVPREGRNKMKAWGLICLLLFLPAAGCSALSSVERAAGKGDAQALLEYLADERSYIREVAARGLGGVGNSAAVTALIERIESPGEFHFVKAAAVESLGRIGNEAAVPVLENLLATSPEQEIRFLCVKVLFLFRDRVPGIVGAIDSARRDESLLVRSLAEAILVKIRE